MGSLQSKSLSRMDAMGTISLSSAPSNRQFSKVANYLIISKDTLDHVANYASSFAIKLVALGMCWIFHTTTLSKRFWPFFLDFSRFRSKHLDYPKILFMTNCQSPNISKVGAPSRVATFKLEIWASYSALLWVHSFSNLLEIYIGEPQGITNHPSSCPFLVLDPSKYNCQGVVPEYTISFGNCISSKIGWSTRKSTYACSLTDFWDTYVKSHCTNARLRLLICLFNSGLESINLSTSVSVITKVVWTRK